MCWTITGGVEISLLSLRVWLWVFRVGCRLSGLSLRGGIVAKPRSHIQRVGNRRGCQVEGFQRLLMSSRAAEVFKLKSLSFAVHELLEMGLQLLGLYCTIKCYTHTHIIHLTFKRALHALKDPRFGQSKQVCCQIQPQCNLFVFYIKNQFETCFSHTGSETFTWVPEYFGRLLHHEV